MSNLEFSVLCSAFCICLHVSITWEGYILNWTHSTLCKLPEFLQKPLFACLPCLGGVWTILLSFLCQRPLNASLALCIGATVGFNTLILLLMNLVEAVQNLETFDGDIRDTPNGEGLETEKEV